MFYYQPAPGPLAGMSAHPHELYVVKSPTAWETQLAAWSSWYALTSQDSAKRVGRAGVYVTVTTSEHKVELPEWVLSRFELVPASLCMPNSDYLLRILAVVANVSESQWKWHMRTYDYMAPCVMYPTPAYVVPARTSNQLLNVIKEVSIACRIYKYLDGPELVAMMLERLYVMGYDAPFFQHKGHDLWSIAVQRRWQQLVRSKFECAMRPHCGELYVRYPMRYAMCVNLHVTGLTDGDWVLSHNKYGAQFAVWWKKDNSAGLVIYDSETPIVDARFSARWPLGVRLLEDGADIQALGCYLHFSYSCKSVYWKYPPNSETHDTLLAAVTLPEREDIASKSYESVFDGEAGDNARVTTPKSMCTLNLKSLETSEWFCAKARVYTDKALRRISHNLRKDLVEITWQQALQTGATVLATQRVCAQALLDVTRGQMRTTLSSTEALCVQLNHFELYTAYNLMISNTPACTWPLKGHAPDSPQMIALRSLGFDEQAQLLCLENVTTAPECQNNRFVWLDARCAYDRTIGALHYDRHVTVAPRFSGTLTYVPCCAIVGSVFVYDLALTAFLYLDDRYPESLYVQHERRHLHLPMRSADNAYESDGPLARTRRQIPHVGPSQPAWLMKVVSAHGYLYGVYARDPNVHVYNVWSLLEHKHVATLNAQARMRAYIYHEEHTVPLHESVLRHWAEAQNCQRKQPMRGYNWIIHEETDKLTYVSNNFIIRVKRTLN